MSEYFGKTISLISVTDNRYVGLLDNIDSDKGTVTLTNVRCFGTEGRKNWGPEEIYPSTTVYKTVQFNGNDVKDLSILEVGLDEVQPVLRPDNGTVPAQQANPEQQQSQQATGSIPKEDLPAAVADYGVYAPTEGANTVGLSSETTDVTNDSQRQRESRPNKSNYNNHHRQQQQQQQQQRPDPSRKIEIPNDDFDFTSNNAKFAKEAPEGHIIDELEEVEKANRDEPHPDGFYNKKSSFFDSISTSAETNTNMRWQEEKALNMDTFGESSARPRFNNRRGNFRGRGRGRGGSRGGSRGGNRGGNRNYNNNNNNNYGNNDSGNFQSGFTSNNHVEF
ncbi:similar to Saccharomyces cerevisiae YPR129W SCD6 Protein containing an Lsm domain [Maudiozyma barnettii]|uniref:Similar to Saccharomyces cerevisiae YPR129W SCD6 Protein containing an Lsm domain n=1 Tax=Maudiozyma barnettii TaxID=61262 RepID=A0A8H2ZF27_9SACH|nr:Scd6p [Kazachstania barnettii]CAB4251875.1 similar to Saccharomyces cerevisiae YPR129W SCD6 Protein containing an Lsm domain [Kazachstania barnettii]CAD1778171.1 similar to Saccharomyces cerevisiae YPR129W SCD6 Protein containing an Lsm domain [Kazachstania barnettii]